MRWELTTDLTEDVHVIHSYQEVLNVFTQLGCICKNKCIHQYINIHAAECNSIQRFIKNIVMVSKVMVTDELLLLTAVYEIVHFVVPIIRCTVEYLKN